MHLHGAATFLGLPKLTRALEQLPKAAEVHVHIEALTYIDHAALVAIAGDRPPGRRASS